MTNDSHKPDPVIATAHATHAINLSTILMLEREMAWIGFLVQVVRNVSSRLFIYYHHSRLYGQLSLGCTVSFYLNFKFQQKANTHQPQCLGHIFLIYFYPSVTRLRWAKGSQNSITISPAPTQPQRRAVVSLTDDKFLYHTHYRLTDKINFLSLARAMASGDVSRLIGWCRMSIHLSLAIRSLSQPSGRAKGCILIYMYTEPTHKAPPTKGASGGCTKINLSLTIRR